jgi:chromosome segregation protein
LYLSKLEIFGFKSFANKTVIKFTKGLTGIVGPNGCGKTNIVDAIRWCLGEQKSSTLRSDKMENVIFNGTRNKKPMGMSEVSLSLINDNGQLPTEYSEITITRRIFRSGESEYLLNKNICRLKDITNLFMDTGMGTNAYSVIELKMVETILSNRAEERRKMFEEAAGVNKYKLRRRLSLKKLDEVKLNLTRVNDIVAEVEKNVRTLERQAKRASKYNQFQTILRDKELDLSDREFALYSNQINDFNSRQSELIEKKNNVDSEIRVIENNLITFRNQTNEIESALRNKQFEISDFTNKLHEVQTHQSVSEERLRTLDTRLDRFNTELEDLFNHKEIIEQSTVRNLSDIENIKSEINDKNFDIEHSENSVSDKKEKLDASKNLLKQINEESLEKFQDLSEKKNRLGNLKNSLNENNSKLQILNDKILKTTTTIAKTVGYLEDLSNEKKENVQRLRDSEELYVTKSNEKNALERKLNDLKEKELTERTSINALKEKINFFQSLITNLEGVSKASKILLESEGWSKSDKTLFADVGNTEEKYRLALESSLKLVLNNLLIADLKDLEKAIEYLQKNELGQASFFILVIKRKKENHFLSGSIITIQRKILKTYRMNHFSLIGRMN